MGKTKQKQLKDKMYTYMMIPIEYHQLVRDVILAKYRKLLSGRILFTKILTPKNLYFQDNKDEDCDKFIYNVNIITKVNDLVLNIKLYNRNTKDVFSIQDYHLKEFDTYPTFEASRDDDARLLYEIKKSEL